MTAAKAIAPIKVMMKIRLERSSGVQLRFAMTMVVKNRLFRLSGFGFFGFGFSALGRGFGFWSGSLGSFLR